MQRPLPRQTPPLSPTMGSSLPSPTTGPCKRFISRSKKAVNQSFADLPSSLLEIIMSRIVLKDNIRASASCKSWREAGIYVRVVEKHPWLMCFPKRGSKNNLFELRDPVQSKYYTLNLPELADHDLTVCYSKDGWLLMHRSSSKDMFFFHPFSRELISLPKLEPPSGEVAFSCPPTSDNCVVLALCYDQIRTCHPGATEWINVDLATKFPLFSMNCKVAYLNDRFYCYNVKGDCLCSFHPSSGTWEEHYTLPIDDHNSRRFLGRKKKGFYLAEKKGELFLMFTRGNEKAMVYKLVSFKWKEISGIELYGLGLTFFVSLYNPELRSDLPWIRNTVYFSRFGYNHKHCAYYSFDENRYNRYTEWQDWLELCPPKSIWIDPPSNVLDYVNESFA